MVPMPLEKHKSYGPSQLTVRFMSNDFTLIKGILFLLPAINIYRFFAPKVPSNQQKIAHYLQIIGVLHLFWPSENDFV